MNHSKTNAVKAVRCHRFASVVPKPTNENQKQKQKRILFQPRKPKPLRLRDCLALGEIPYPTLPKKRKGTWVVIKTEYAGIQYPDALQARGLYQIKPRLPYIPGMDAVGIVLKVVLPTHNSRNRAPNYHSIQNVDLKPGDRVMATTLEFGGTGGLSEVVLSPLKYVFKLPPPSPTTSIQISNSNRYGAMFANIGRNYFAAYHALVEVGQIDPSQSASINASKIVLVTGGSGGVGMATIELAKAMGCIVVAGVGSPSKSSGPASVGADAVFCYGRTKPQHRAFRKHVTTFCHQQRTAGVDLVVDVVMGDLFQDALVGCLKPLGTIALVGFAAGQRAIKPGILLVKEARVAGSIWLSIAVQASESNKNNKYYTMVNTILGYLASGKIRGRVDKIVPVSRFIEAFEIFEENKGRGNTVVSFVDEKNGSRSRL